MSTETTPTTQASRKHADGRKLNLKDEEGFFTNAVTIVSARYDESQHVWMYTVKDGNNNIIEGETREDHLE